MCLRRVGLVSWRLSTDCSGHVLSRRRLAPVLQHGLLPVERPPVGTKIGFRLFRLPARSLRRPNQRTDAVDKFGDGNLSAQTGVPHSLRSWFLRWAAVSPLQFVDVRFSVTVLAELQVQLVLFCVFKCCSFPSTWILWSEQLFISSLPRAFWREENVLP